VAFGSHSVSHPDLTRISPEELAGEILNSKTEIERRTGRPVKQFCYPYGEWNRAVRDAVAEHYEAACSTGAGVLDPASDPLALPRVDACYVREPGWFQHLFSVRFHAYVAARRAVRKLRRKPEGKYARLRG
jgi:peptidoglycan/xylan/chitin deacetylase (PgdA/CDA1 family)